MQRDIRIIKLKRLAKRTSLSIPRHKVSVLTSQNTEHSDEGGLEDEIKDKEDISCFDENGNVKHYQTKIFIWAGYLPPGKQTIYIYDRINKRILQKDVVIDMSPEDS